jgi:membrane-associated phospholipid phosphatase
MAEILVEMDELLAPLAQVVNLERGNLRWTDELIATFYRTVLTIEMAFKNAMAVRRPTALSPQVVPMIPTPAHSSFPSGHGIESFSLAYLLAKLAKVGLDPQIARAEADGDATAATALRNQLILTADQLLFQARRIAENRTVAGVHYPVDNDAGAKLGLALGRYLVARGAETDLPNGTSFVQPADPLEDFDPRRAWVDALPEIYVKGGGDPAHKPGREADAPWREMWSRATAEWVL